VQIDDLDAKIIALLQENGRRTSVEIARLVGVSQSTVKNRLDKLLQNGACKVLAVINPEKFGYPLDAFIGVNTDPDAVVDVGESLLRIPQVYWVGHMTGRYDLLVEVALQDTGDLFDFVTRRIASIPGVRSSETAIVMRQSKWRPAEWRLPSRSPEGKAVSEGDGAIDSLGERS
jgi:Lrp/AsnC family transcriptional regulator for asnA, asnC and gidA